MKCLVTDGLMLVATLFLMNACASRDDVVTESSSAQTTATVPGEKIPDDGRVVPGTGTNPNASVRW